MHPSSVAGTDKTQTFHDEGGLLYVPHEGGLYKEAIEDMCVLLHGSDHTPGQPEGNHIILHRKSIATSCLARAFTIPRLSTKSKVFF